MSHAHLLHRKKKHRYNIKKNLGRQKQVEKKSNTKTNNISFCSLIIFVVVAPKKQKKTRSRLWNDRKKESNKKILF